MEVLEGFGEDLGGKVELEVRDCEEESVEEGIEEEGKDGEEGDFAVDIGRFLKDISLHLLRGSVGFWWILLMGEDGDIVNIF